MNKKSTTKITFKLESPTYVSIIRAGKRIGHVYSDREESYKVGDDAGGKPYPHEESIYCLNAIQICGFDKISETWGCGPFHGKKDCVMHFLPLTDDYIKSKLKGYRTYVENKMNKEEHDSIQNFHDWDAHNI